MSMTSLPNAKVEASKIFDRDLRILCARYANRRSTVRLREEIRLQVVRMVAWLYENDGYVIDQRNGSKVATAAEVHVGVRYDKMTRSVTVDVVRKVGRLH